MAEPRGITIDPTDYPFPTRHEVIAAIRDAFSGVDRDNAISLHEADVIDGYGTAYEQAAAHLLDIDQIWKQVPTKDIEQHSAALSQLDPKSFRYYIPAYMVHGVERELAWADDSTSALIFHLSRLDNHEPYHQRRLEMLNDIQRRAIALFLLFFSTDKFSGHSARDALKRFWNEYLPEQYC